MLRSMTRLALLGLAAALPLSTSGCVPGARNVHTVFGIFVNLAPKSPSAEKKSKKKAKLKENLGVDLDVTIGGLDGTFDIGVGEYGTLTGTVNIKGQKGARAKAKSDEQVAALVEALILDRTGVTIQVTKSKTTFKGSQTTGGVKKKFKCQIVWKGQVTAGAEVGKRVRGKIKTKGSYE